MKAYYFAPNDNKLRYGDGRKIVIGKMHTVKCIPKLCEIGLHGSVKALDALTYAAGNMLYIVDISRNLDIGEDKICGQRRKYIAGFDAEHLLREFARKQAMINIEKIKPYTKDYNLIISYLNTGDVSQRYAAWSAAKFAAEAAAKSAAKFAAESAAESAARSVVWSAAEAAAKFAAKFAAESAAESAAKSAARSVVWSAAEAAAWSAAESAAESAANYMLEQMISVKLEGMQNV